MNSLKKMVGKGKARIVDSLLYFTFFQKYIGKKWYRRWEKNFDISHEEPEFQILKKILPENAIACDIGANRGEASYYFSQIVQCSKVYSFEPQKRMFTILSAAMEKIPQVVPFNIALSDTAESRKIFIPIRNAIPFSQMASFEATSDKHGVHTIEETVGTMRLDDFIKDQKITSLDFIKCDTEGHELNVFRGGEKTLATMRPFVITEIYPHKEAGHKEAVLDFFQKNNYSLFFYEHERLVRNGNSSCNNYIFIPNEKIAHFTTIGIIVP